MELLTLFNSEMSEIKKEAVELHLEIKKNAELTAAALVEFCKGLKKMRDKKLYVQLGCESFAEYAKKAFNIEQRQAYNYIQALERLGEPILQSNANLGITKLNILSEIPRLELEQFVEENNVAEMSTKQLKEAVEKATKAEEQLTFMYEEREKLKEEIDELRADQDDRSKEIEEYENIINSLKQELKEEKSKPVPTVKQELTPEEIKKLTEKAVSDERKKLEKDKADAVAGLKKQLKAAEEQGKKQVAEVEEKYKSVISSAEKDKADIAAKLAQVEKNSKVTANPDALKFKIYFDAAQNNILELKKIISSVDEETAKKFKEAMSALADRLIDKPKVDESGVAI